MKQTLGLFALVPLVLAGCSTVSPGSAAIQTWIGIHAPLDWIAPEEMSLEIGEAAWSITPDGGAGVVTADLGATEEVRLVGVADCRLYAAFSASPGSSHVIRFGEDGSVRVEDITGQPTAMGPGLNERDPTDCEESAD